MLFQLHVLGHPAQLLADTIHTSIQTGSTFVMPSSKEQKENMKISFDTMNDFVKAGGNFIDTADIYGEGAAEKVGWLGQVTESEEELSQLKF